MENVFANLSAQISTSTPEAETETPKRHAFVFLTAEPNSCMTALYELKKIEGVKEVYLSRGAYDLIVKITGESLEHMRDVVLKSIKNLGSIKSTLTLTVI